MRDLAIAYGNCRQAKTWVNKTIRYTELKNRLRTTTHTTESAEEYARMSKAQRTLPRTMVALWPGYLLAAYVRLKPLSSVQ